MIILTAGHTGAHTGAQCATTHFDEGAENIWLRNRIAEILTNKYNLVVLIDNDHASLQLLTKELNNPKITETEATRILSPCLRGTSSKSGGGSFLNFCDKRAQRSSLQLPSVAEILSEAKNPHSSFLIDLHFNAHTNPNARGTEAIVSDDATTIELRFATRLAHATAEALEIPLRSIKSETQTPHRRLAMLHLTPQSIILEICFCTSPEDVAQYRQHREQLANALAHHIAELLQTHL